MSWRDNVESGNWLSGKPLLDYSKGLFIGIISLFALATALSMASVFTFRDPEHVRMAWSAFALFGTLNIGLQILRENALSDRTEAAERSYREQQEAMVSKQVELNDLAEKMHQSQLEFSHNLKTMPPAAALSVFTKSFELVLQLWRSREEDFETVDDAQKAIEDYQSWIRMGLNAIARLFFQYEHKPLTARCTAHIAEFVHVGDLDDDPNLREEVKRELRFVNNSDDPLYALHGVLRVSPALSAVCDPDQQDSDAEDPSLTHQFYLPVPDGVAKNGFSPFLPVAPQAFDEGVCHLPRVAEDIPNSKGVWNVTPAVAQEVVDFFKGDEFGKVGTAVGYRLKWLNKKPGDAPNAIKLGVLTITTAEPAVKDSETIETFFQLVQPMIEMQKTMLFAIMNEREAISSGKYEPKGT